MTIKVEREKCDACEACISACPHEAVFIEGETAAINDNCVICGLCIDACPQGALYREIKSKDLDLTGWSGIWVFAEQDRRGIKRVALELLCEAVRLAEGRDATVAALLMGSGVQEHVGLLFQHGAEKIYLLDDPGLMPFRIDIYTSLVVRAVQKYRPEILLFGASVNGRVLAPAIAVKLGTGLTADCTALAVDREGRLVQTRPAFGGNLMASILCADTRPQMATVRPNVMDRKALRQWRRGDIISLGPPLEQFRSRVARTGFVETEGDALDLERAEIIVCGGFGVGSPEKFRILRDLADSLGAAMGCTRKVVDEGWMSHDRQVGQTGKTVRPRIYIACGISGAIQHQMGMDKSDTIIAVNSDPGAPIFNIADYGIVGDLFEVVPRLKERLLQMIRKD
jgi:electron transfer flavoprotein alpha subunit